MKVIYKYQLSNIKGINELELPKDARPLKVDFQRNGLMLWCLVDTEQPTELRKFFCAVTGLDLELENIKYIGTCQIIDTAYVTNVIYVTHVFEVI